MRYRSATTRYERLHRHQLLMKCSKCDQEFVLYWDDSMDEIDIRVWFNGYVAINHPHQRDGFSINEQFPEVDAGASAHLRPGKLLLSRASFAKRRCPIVSP